MEDGWGEKETKERVSEVAEFSVNALRIWIGDRRLVHGARARVHMCVYACLCGEGKGWVGGGGGGRSVDLCRCWKSSNIYKYGKMFSHISQIEPAFWKTDSA